METIRDVYIYTFTYGMDDSFSPELNYLAFDFAKDCDICMKETASFTPEAQEGDFNWEQDAQKFHVLSTEYGSAFYLVRFPVQIPHSSKDSLTNQIKTLLKIEKEK